MSVDTHNRNDAVSQTLNLQSELSSLSGRKVMLMLTDNRSSVLTVKHESGVAMVRAHRMFLEAPREVITSLGKWVAGKRLGKDLIQEFINSNEHKIYRPECVTRKTILKAQGRYHDLEELREYLNESFLENRSKAPVTWGRKATRNRTHTIRLGCYDPARNLITMNRRLDRSDIPRYMVEFVLYHEMLHEVLGIGERPDGKRDIHGKTFRMMEHTYPHFSKAKEFERKKWG